MIHRRARGVPLQKARSAFLQRLLGLREAVLRRTVRPSRFPSALAFSKVCRHAPAIRAAREPEDDANATLRSIAALAAYPPVA